MNHWRTKQFLPQTSNVRRGVRMAMRTNRGMRRSRTRRSLGPSGLLIVLIIAAIMFYLERQEQWGDPPPTQEVSLPTAP